MSAEAMCFVSGVNKGMTLTQRMLMLLLADGAMMDDDGWLFVSMRPTGPDPELLLRKVGAPASDLGEAKAMLQQLQDDGVLDGGRFAIERGPVRAQSYVKPRPGFIYAAVTPGQDLYKIGYSMKPPERVQTVAASLKRPLSLVNTWEVEDRIAAEQAMHVYLTPFRKPQDCDGGWEFYDCDHSDVAEAADYFDLANGGRS